MAFHSSDKNIQGLVQYVYEGSIAVIDGIFTDIKSKQPIDSSQHKI